MANEIFISYKTEDKEIVKDIKNAIDEKIGAGHCWMDIDGIETGVKDYESPLYKAIQNSSVFLFMISDRSVDSEFCLDELDWAIEVYEKDENKHLVFVLIDPSFQLKGAFKRNYIQRRDIIDYNDSDRFAKLIRDLRKWLDIPEVDPLDEVREEVKELEKDYKPLAKRWKIIDEQMREKMKLLGEKEFVCPVCNEKNEVVAPYCQRCGYILSYFEGASYEDSRLELLRLNWKAKNDLIKDTELLEKENKQLTKDLDSLNSELQKSQSEYAALKQRYDEDKKYLEEVKKKEEEEATKRLAEEERKPYMVFDVNGAIFKMVRVEGGTFQMGATIEQGNYAKNDEIPVHSVTLSDFMVGETVVTRELWAAVMGSNPSYFKGAKNPVACVSWDDCRDFISKLNTLTDQNFRLPTEAEWEFAARGGNKSGHFKFSGSNSIGEVAWYDNSEICPVGTKKPNELGIYDMSGNVWEWCEDRYGDYNSSQQTNPKGPDEGSCRVLRGGSYCDSARYCRVSRRNYNTPDYSRYGLGLRLALSL